QLAEMAINISGKTLRLDHIEGPLGVRGRNSDNDLIKKQLNWGPSYSLKKGLGLTYKWILEQMEK
ncbi:NAD-dependent dehydratase, partial [bacterium]|nr:NAD-dependent dehydratase [bacterium]